MPDWGAMEGHMGRLDGKTAVVTGGNRGIGHGIALALAAEGARVAITARKAEDARTAAAALGGSVCGYACDVRNEAEVVALFRSVASDLGGTDILINNAGIGIFAPVADLSPDDWRAVIETNLNGVFYCCHEAIPQMRARGGGYIVNLSSLAGVNAFPKAAAYNASKFGLNGFSEALMQEVRWDGIRVSYLMPGSVATEFGSGSTAKQGWALTPEDVALQVVTLVTSPPHALYSRVEMRPSQPPRKG
jgi:NAD(P)-dependent dehydrogenase (short-subunit alcohol dehydrogenase family)